MSTGLTRCALGGVVQATDGKCATEPRTGPNTSWQSGKRAGEGGKVGRCLRIGTVNVGSMRKRGGEVVDMAARRQLDFCCLQETRWKEEGARVFGSEEARYKFFWIGCKEGDAGVGILVAEKWIDKVIEVKWVNERIILVRIVVGKCVVNLVSAYAPQVGRRKEEKEEFFALLGKVVMSIDPIEKLVLCGDMNGHVGARVDGYEEVHGGNGYGTRNVEGEMLLEFADAMELAVANTWFQKEDTKKVTYESGGSKTVVDYILIKRSDRRLLSDVKVIGSEACITQHKLLVCKMELQEHVKRRREVFVSKCRIWKLKEAERQSNFYDKVRARAVDRTVGDVEDMWNGLKDCLLEVSDVVCGRTKRHSRHKVTWWWNDDIAEAVKKKRELFNIWHKSKLEEDRVPYKLAKRNVARMIFQAQKVVWNDFGARLEEEDGKGNLFRLAKQMVRTNMDVVGGACVKDKEEKIVC